MNKLSRLKNAKTEIEKVTAWLERIKATKEEKDAVVEQLKNDDDRSYYLGRANENT